MGREHDPGSDRVTELTRRFELEDEQVFSGAGRGPTPDEARAAERYGAASEATRQAYMEMVWRGAQQRGEGRIGR